MLICAPTGSGKTMAAQQEIPMPEVLVGIRTGDTAQKDRQRMLTYPPDILITTLESLFIMLTVKIIAHIEDRGVLKR